MHKENICIATITWARNDAEEKLLKDSLQQLAALNIPVMITDGGSGQSFIDFLKSFPHFTVMTISGKGLIVQVRNSLLLASETGLPFIFYTEPDKQDFFTTELPGFLERVKANENTGIIMAARSPAGFRSFPAFQQMTETTINNCCKEIIGKQLDYTYGPFLINRELLMYFKDVGENIGWGWRPYAFIIAKRLGYSVEAIEGDFNCPDGQQQDDAHERMHRIRQLEQNIRGIVISTEAILPGN